MDGQIEAYSTEEEEANASLLPLIGLLWNIMMKEGRGDQASTELLLIADRAAIRKRFSTSDIVRNPLKIPEPEIELDDEDYLSMIKNPLAVGVVRIHMIPQSMNTSFGGLAANTLKGVATLITPAGPFKMEGA